MGKLGSPSRSRTTHPSQSETDRIGTSQQGEPATVNHKAGLPVLSGPSGTSGAERVPTVAHTLQLERDLPVGGVRGV